MNLSEDLDIPDDSWKEPPDFPLSSSRQELSNIESENQAVSPENHVPSRSSLFSFRAEKIGPAFWTITGILSLMINIVLIVILLSIGKQLFTLKYMVTEQLIGGLYGNFILMDQATIRTIIPIRTEVPAKFDLPLDTDTTVVLSEDVIIQNATVKLQTGGLVIANAPADIVLPANTKLPIHLNLVVPVDEMIPVNLDVNVEIPLQDTDLHVPFTGLQNVVSPYYNWLSEIPGSWEEVLCGKTPSRLCQSIFP